MKIVLATRAFWFDALERAVKTAAQTAVALIGTNAVDVTALDWANIGWVSAGAAVVSVLTSIASSRAPGVSPASVVPPGL